MQNELTAAERTALIDKLEQSINKLTEQKATIEKLRQKEHDEDILFRFHLDIHFMEIKIQAIKDILTNNTINL
jgi:prefoldin subunit 5